MTSRMDLRPIVEAAFLPMRCACVIAADTSMTIQILHPGTDAEEFTVAGIDTAKLNSIRDIVAFVLDVKAEMALRRSASYLH
ncbi:DUF1652 domain-containing protein [Pseudomonas tremae]|uniref:DUF1652 domain-containing protein n=1 Tax=Pseudomonas TaxID=286 RepID=UPI0001AF6079|nr:MULTISPECIES: DUF1652 domain-containing protein [Pseudomonas]MCQ3018592.1 DUF1652 domain-containing protein [Pseudomonas tremae]PBQ10309.1 DUF1652 domain-containing protein [Pseudomonas congelans]QGL58618.1 DUF1652 domain-containing protein [Pseudomonas coronafaciens pv. oryzae str. 1_6]RMM36674.1 hypothetical protein ALQ80_200124 [Pseudomonas coronafaciens pv. oryzae]